MKQRVLVIGLGLSGCSAAQFLLDRGFHVMAFDQNQATRTDAHVTALQKRGMTFLEEEKPSCDFVVVSPGVPREHFLYRRVLEEGIEVIGEIELACRYLTNPVFGITGTNGKTTVALLFGHVLNSCGRKARVVGNVGTPLTSVLSDLQDDEILVCELSSFQLETMQSRVLHGGVILNITPDHLDRYGGDFQAYAATKISMQTFLKPGAPLYVEWKVSRDLKE